MSLYNGGMDAQPKPFESWWEESCRPDATPALAQLLHPFFEAFVAPTPNLTRLRETLVTLLDYLKSADGETEDNLFTVDAFFCLLTAEHNSLLERLPDDFQALIDTIGMDLGEGVEDPETARAMGATPEMLLEKARALRAPSDVN